MKLLGALGLDWKIFLIQILNFLILFFILKWLFFKPFIAALKKEKAKAKEIKEIEGNIEKEKIIWQKEKEKEILEIKKKVNNMLANAKIFADNIKKENTEKFLEEQKKLLEKIDKQSKAITNTYKKSMVRDYKKKIFSGIIDLFKAEFSSKSKTDIQNGFWLPFIKKINSIGKNEIIQIFQQSRKKAPLVSIYSSLPLTNNQKNDLQIILERKKEKSLSNIFSKNNLQVIFQKKSLPKKFKIKKDIKRDLIAGFQLELGGILIEENLKSKIVQVIKE
ncbi:MAG: hypothetical protein GWO87_01780 [Xanthomonadaceae bacterium]|nr:hypothetical protein [Rhodospirillaceae bacterium]NIA17900.1 hypothetical protein [Xanthomonadaceae bacterium]